MVDWYSKKTIFLIIFCCFWIGDSLDISARATSLSEPNSTFNSAQKIKFHNWMARIPLRCEAINSKYQEVYSFETENYQINICRLGKQYYYHRQSKLEQSDEILIPAQAVDRGRVFQADDGRTTYFVGKSGDRYYSSVMQNNNEIVFEPQIQFAAENAPENVAEVNSSLPGDWQANQTNNASLELDRPKVSSEELLCVRESTLESDLNGWQKLIGKSTASVNKYAVNQGYSFIYSEEKPNLASIVTQDGAVIDLSIASGSETIERVCIQPDTVSREP